MESNYTDAVWKIESIIQSSMSNPMHWISIYNNEQYKVYLSPLAQKMSKNYFNFKQIVRRDAYLYHFMQRSDNLKILYHSAEL